MKSYLLILISLIFLIPFSGCKKKSFDPSGKSREDFIGNWKGSISTFKNNQLLKESGTVSIYADATTKALSGILFMKATNVFHEFQFVNGTLYFKVINNDPGNPICQNWSLEGYAVFSSETTLDIRITGNECGQLGSEYVNWAGILVQDQVSPDSVKYNHFAKTGNSWTYKVTLKSGDSCQVVKQISQETVTYLFSGSAAQTCGWTGQNNTFKWNVSPTGFSIVNDSTLSIKPFLFPINAKQGVVYRNYINNDTTTVTLLDTNVLVTTLAGNFTCVRFRYTEPVYADTSKTTKISRTAYLWINNRYGVIKHEVVNPVDSTDVQLQILTTKSF
jgi:hypothetical protein